MQRVVYYGIHAICLATATWAAAGLYSNYLDRQERAARQTYGLAQVEVGARCTKIPALVTKSRPPCPSNSRANRRFTPDGD